MKDFDEYLRTKQDIYALLEKDETFHLECKKTQGSLPGSLWESYSAFCNTDGGVILLGVKEEGGLLVVEGVEDDVALVKSFWDAVHNPEKVSSCVLAESDARNQYIFNIFALVKIGERSGHGLSNLFGVWKKSGYPEPMISESYDPDRTTIELKLDEVSSGRVKSSVESAANQIADPKLAQNWPKTGPKNIAELPASVRQVYVALCENSAMTLRGLASKLRFSKTTITTAIATLIKRGLPRRVGPKKGGHWEIFKPQPPTGGIGS